MIAGNSSAALRTAVQNTSSSKHEKRDGKQQNDTNSDAVKRHCICSTCCGCTCLERSRKVFFASSKHLAKASKLSAPQVKLWATISPVEIQRWRPHDIYLKSPMKTEQWTWSSYNVLLKLHEVACFNLQPIQPIQPIQRTPWMAELLFFMVSMGETSSMAFRRPWHRTLEFTSTCQMTGRLGGTVFPRDAKQKKTRTRCKPRSKKIWK